MAFGEQEKGNGVQTAVSKKWSSFYRKRCSHLFEGCGDVSSGQARVHMGKSMKLHNRYYGLESCSGGWGRRGGHYSCAD